MDEILAPQHAAGGSPTSCKALVGRMVAAERAVHVTREPQTSTPGELLAIAVRIAREAAATARRMRDEAITDVQTKSTDTDVVTAADRAVERQVVAALRAERPADGVLGEEYGDSTSTAAGAVRWILDPIDGTVNYLYGLPQYAVSLAAEVDGVVVAGVVRNAATGDEWTATLGGGARRGDRLLSGSVRTTLDQTLLATGFGYDAARRAHQGAVLAGLITRVRDIRRFGAAALDLCMAAEGSVDAYYEKGLNPWDHAAGGLIATEAGLTVSGLDGATADRTMLIAAPPALFGALHDALAELDAAGGP
jgi:myo-inositol-1(or 4)-monophosphatase